LNDSSGAGSRALVQCARTGSVALVRNKADHFLAGSRSDKMALGKTNHATEVRMMTSVMDKIEALKSVGAEELVNKTLAKLIELEMSRVRQEQRRLKAELDNFEQAYRMSSEECSQKFESGELGDAVEFFDWTSLYDIYQRNEKTLCLLEEKLR
jgi:hypothetical protein